MDTLTSAAKVIVQYDKVDRNKSDASGKLVEKLSKSPKIIKKSKKPQKLKKVMQATGLEERLPKHQSSVSS